MFVQIVTISIKPEFRDRYLEAIKGDARGSNEDEPGCVRFDVVLDANDPNKIHLYEAYRDQAALDAHRKAPHYLKWREEVKDWSAGPSSRVTGSLFYPPEAAFPPKRK
ncbi:MAG: putative quinol monooxygenase [Chloroflexota bacterium]|nr:putative quinol monooxygenase [Chloroflexota bacterium]